MVLPEHGAWQQYLIVRADEVILIPEIDENGYRIEISCLGVVGIGLHHIFALDIVRTLNLQPCSKVLIFSAGGAMVSLIRIAFPRYLGAHKSTTRHTT